MTDDSDTNEPLKARARTLVPGLNVTDGPNSLRGEVPYIQLPVLAYYLFARIGVQSTLSVSGYRGLEPFEQIPSRPPLVKHPDQVCSQHLADPHRQRLDKLVAQENHRAESEPGHPKLFNLLVCGNRSNQPPLKGIPEKPRTSSFF